MLTPSDTAPRDFAGLFDSAGLAAELTELANLHAGNERELRSAVALRLKAALVQGRATAERLLLADRRGRLCAERLSYIQDEVTRLLFEFAQKHLYPAENP